MDRTTLYGYSPLFVFITLALLFIIYLVAYFHGRLKFAANVQDP